MKFKTAVIYFSLLIAGIYLSDHKTWMESLGGLFILTAGYICGRIDGKQSNKISDHFRRMTKR